MKAKLADLEKSIQTLEGKVKNCTDCPLVLEIKREIQKEKSYITVMKEQLDAECCRSAREFAEETPSGLVNTNESLYKDNLDAAKNWFYGNQTVDQYVYKTFEATTKYNLSACPKTQPYALSQFRGCTFCPETEQFNLLKRQCEACGNFQRFDVYIKKCVKVYCQPYEEFPL